MSDKPEFFMVIFDPDEMSVPMAWNGDCEGALCCLGGNDNTVALFTSRKAARAAIDVSAKWNALLKAQSKPYNDDFSTWRHKLSVVPTSVKYQIK